MMYATVKGVSIELTPTQVAKVEKELRSRERCRNNFVKVLKKFGFKQLDTSDWLSPDQLAFAHPYFNWYASIEKYSGWDECWLVGSQLKSSNGIPGGWNYSDAQIMGLELAQALDNQERNPIGVIGNDDGLKYLKVKRQ